METPEKVNVPRPSKITISLPPDFCGDNGSRVAALVEALRKLGVTWEEIAEGLKDLESR